MPLADAPPLDDDGPDRLAAEFERRYDRRYGGGASSPTARIEWVNLRLESVAPASATPAREPPGPANASAARIGVKDVYDLERRRFAPTPHFAADALRPGHRIDGPAVVVAYGATIPLHRGQRLGVDSGRNLSIEFAA